VGLRHIIFPLFEKVEGTRPPCPPPNFAHGDTDEANLKKRWSGTHSNYKVEWLKDPDLKG